MTNRATPIVTILLLAVAGLAFAQTPAMIVEYYENTSGAMYVRTADGAEYDADQFGFGEELPPGATLVTLDGDYAELRLEPNGTIIRVAENTNFTVDSLQGRDGAPQNTFSVAVGKLRAVVAKSDGSRYQFRGATAVCGVRGTKLDFRVLPGIDEIIYCLDGLLDYTNAAGQTIAVSAGEAANALAADFRAFIPPPDLLGQLQQGLGFEVLSPDEVPGYIKEVAEAATEQIEEATTPEEMKEEGAEDKTPKWLEKLMEFMGLELGTVTLESETWAKAIIQPRFGIGKVKVALYLPIIYQNDILNPSTWYHPNGNDEWSFGFDQSSWDAGLLDALNDLFLKIRYVKYGEQRDPFFFKFGSLDDITIGHGLIMDDYANDADFPAIRKVGFNLGVDREKAGVEAMISDAADPQLFGVRGYYRPGGRKFPLAFGLTGLTDLNPEKVPLYDPGSAIYGMPVFVNFGFDLDLPVVESKVLSIILFGDAGAMVPYLRENVPAGTLLTLTDGNTVTTTTDIAAGWKWDAFWDGGPRNWGAMTGLLEYRYSQGTFKPAFYGPLYDRRSAALAAELLAYLDDPTNPAYGGREMGIYGELGYTLEKIFYITGSYYWPWPVGDVPASAWPDDTLGFEFGILKGLLPLYGSVGMYREDTFSQLMRNPGGGISFFDENLLFYGEIVYPVSALLDLAIQVTTPVSGDTWYPSLTILTRVGGGTQ
jgi:uncharacterized cupin superfamily protein